MKYSTAKLGRVFIIRLKDGEILHEEIERFAKTHEIKAASITAVGGIDKNSKLIVGPESAREQPVVPMEFTLDHVHEVTGTGTIFPDDTGSPILHMHLSCGRKSSTITGCVRSGVIVWHVMELVVIELTETTAHRTLDPNTGFKLLDS